jgi:uncharacterized protein (DUF433 family)
MTAEKQNGYIVQTPGVSGGKPRIDGHRLRVQDIAFAYQWRGWCPEEICQQFPGISLAQVHAALAYYFDHRDEILADIEADEKTAAEGLRRQSDVARGA